MIITNKISDKLKSYAHQEYNNNTINKVELIEKKLKKGEDILGRNLAVTIPAMSITSN